MQTKHRKLLNILILIGTVLAALKVLFVDYSMDEEYQIVMAYRHLSGDAYFGAMWEPHQTSAYLCAGLMRFFVFLTGGCSGVLLYLRVCTTLIQMGLSFWIFRVLQRFLEREEAVLVALLYFNIVPKLIEIPEFGNLQLWFWTGLTLCLLEYETHPKFSGKPWLIWLGGICLSMEILSYPSSIVVFPLALVYLCVRGKKTEEAGQPAGSCASARRGRMWKDPLHLCASCAACALIWLLLILSQVSFSEFLRNVRYIVEFDLTHDLDVSAGGKLQVLAAGLGQELWLTFLAVFAAGLLFAGISLFRKKKGQKPLSRALTREQAVTLLCSLAMLFSLLIQLWYWLILRRGFEEPQIHLFVTLLLSAVLWRYAGESRRHLLFGILSGALTLLAVLYMSDLTFYYAVPHALLGSVFGLVLAGLALREQFGAGSAGLIRLLLVSFVIICAFGKGFTLRGGRGSDITNVAGIMKHGPAAGVLADYMCAYIYNSNWEDYRSVIGEGENVLIVTNMVFSPGTTPYLFTDAKICHFSIVDPTSYDERLLKYWELYPEKRPEVIVVDCWYGQLMEDPDNWIMRYIENDFGYTQALDGKYVRFYRR